jgi:hypothetical protein
MAEWDYGGDDGYQFFSQSCVLYSFDNDRGQRPEPRWKLTAIIATRCGTFRCPDLA